MRKTYFNPITNTEIIDVSGNKSITEIKNRFGNADYQQVNVGDNEVTYVESGVLMKKDISKPIINEEEQIKGDTSVLISNLKKLNISDFDPSKISTTISLVKQNKSLNNAANKILADIMVAMIKTNDDSLLNKIFSNLKNIEATK